MEDELRKLLNELDQKVKQTSEYLDANIFQDIDVNDLRDQLSYIEAEITRVQEEAKWI